MLAGLGNPPDGISKYLFKELLASYLDWTRHLKVGVG